MRLILKVFCAIGVAAVIALTASVADARTYRRHGAGAREYVYGANHAPYGRDEDNSRDFQLQGAH
jgi:hypothetical protein